MQLLLGLEIPNFLPDALGLRAAGRLIWTTVLFVVLLAPVLIAIRRPKPAQKTTWAQAMAGAVYVWALLVLAYGSIPHEWLQFANGHLKWDESHYILTSGQEVVAGLRWLNFDVNKRAITDTVATVIYVVMLVVNVWLFAKWQKRPEATAADGDAATTGKRKIIGRSAFGRPVSAEA